MKTYIIGALLLALPACSPPVQTKININYPVSTITAPIRSTTATIEEQAIEEQLVAPVPTSKFSNGAPVRTPIGCREGMTRGVDC